MPRATTYLHNRIAVAFAFDLTLAADSFDALLGKLDVDPDAFSEERVHPLIDEGWDDSLARCYAFVQLSDERDGAITESLLQEVGRALGLFDGLPEAFDTIREVAQAMPVAAPRTRTGLRPMTPEYAAPEQVRAGPITTATDVYGRGVVLYELLTGRRPYRVAGRTPSEIERAVCEQEPPLPSTVVIQSAEEGGAPEEAGHARSTTPDGLQRTLRGDLDTIVRKALRKTPSAATTRPSGSRRTSSATVRGWRPSRRPTSKTS